MEGDIDGSISGYLNLVADVDDEGVRERSDGDPGVILADLEAGDVVVDEEDGHAAGVGVGREAQRELRLRALRVEVNSHARSFLVERRR